MLDCGILIIINIDYIIIAWPHASGGVEIKDSIYQGRLHRQSN